jgi:GAF domain
MISVVDQNYQYIIAEGTKTLSLQNGTVIDQDDQLWFGLRTIQRSVGICARALGQFTQVESQDGSTSDTLFAPMQFIIPDLSKDPRFENQPFVSGTPYLRFYAGVPIRSPAGYIIGIYSVVDDRPRNDFGERDLAILRDLAATVMDHLVLGTVRGRHHRADRMVKGLGLFIEGKSTLRDWWLRSGHLAHGPTTSDGSRGGWTLKERADAEFGPQVHNSHTPQQQSGFSPKSPRSKTSETRTSSPALVDAPLCSASNGTQSSDSALPGENFQR